MRWSDIEQAQPRLAVTGRDKLIKPGVVLVVTIRRDGTPLLSPVEPYLLDGDLWLSMMWESTKARDLLRDPRILVHSVITGRDGAEGEFKVRGTVRDERDQSVALWPEGREFIRRGTSATTVGDPEPVRSLLRPA